MTSREKRSYTAIFFSIMASDHNVKSLGLDSYPRDFVGYGRHWPKFSWPDGKRLAISFVINYEEVRRRGGSEKARQRVSGALVACVTAKWHSLHSCSRSRC
jgi:hypothetical protein